MEISGAMHAPVTDYTAARASYSVLMNRFISVRAVSFVRSITFSPTQKKERPAFLRFRQDLKQHAVKICRCLINDETQKKGKKQLTPK